MKLFSKTLINLLMVCLPTTFFSCGSDGPSVTGDVETVYTTAAEITCYVNVDDKELADVQYGILGSFDDNVSIENYNFIQSGDSLQGNQFSVTLSGLRANTKYYYRSYTLIGDDYNYGDIKIFTTKAAKPTATLATAEGCTALIDCTTNLEDFELLYDANSCGILWSSDASFCGEEYDKVITDNDIEICEALTIDYIDEGNYSALISDLCPFTTYYYRAFTFTNGIYTLSEVGEFTTGEQEEADWNYHDYVDLGLPSGTLWATCNIGANSPEEYGDYFAWGEVNTKGRYDRSTYKYFDENKGQMTKYVQEGWESLIDNKSHLDLEDDAAYVNWGADWCIPNYNQIKELCNSNYTTTCWTTHNGVYGCKVTSRQNGNAIFLPAAGWYDVTDIQYAGSFGIYRSSQINLAFSNKPTFTLRFGSSKFDWTSSDRFKGQSIRPVRRTVSE